MNPVSPCFFFSVRYYNFFVVSSHPNEIEVPEIPSHLGDSSKDDKDKYEQEIAADLRSKFDLDLDFRYCNLEGDLDDFCSVFFLL